MDLFYAIHVHMHSEWSPFEGPVMADLDPVAAQGYIEQVRAIAGVLEAHGAVGSFHFTVGTAAGLCIHAPEFFDALEDSGHEIGIHAHSNEFLLRAADAMTGVCGREIDTGSGLAAMAGGPDGSTPASLAASLEVFRRVGASQLLVNVAKWCGTTSSGGNALAPWRVEGDDLCAADHDGILLIDQASLEYVLTDGAPADVFSEYEFATLAGLAEAAIAEAASLPGPIAVWGFVTHTNEYVLGATATARPEESALAGLDLLLGRLDTYVESGRARWSTAAEIAARVP